MTDNTNNINTLNYRKLKRSLEGLSKEVDKVERLYMQWAKNITKSTAGKSTSEERASAKAAAEVAGRELFTPDLVLLDQIDDMRQEELAKRRNPLAAKFTDRVQHFRDSLSR